MEYSWKNLNEIYYQKETKEFLESLEMKFHGKDESNFFRSLVNTSLSNCLPYHRWIRYREGYAGELVKEILGRYPINSHELVLDPMCGSGSTIVACNEMGINSIGLDVNPYAVLATEVKGYKLASEQLAKARGLISDVIRMSKNKSFTPNEFELDTSKYFTKENFLQLVSIKNSIKILCNDILFKIFYFALLAILEECSNRKKDGNGLATRHTKISDCYSLFASKISNILEDFSKHPYPKKSLSSSLLLSAKNLDDPTFNELLNGRKLGSIIFSPPYANSFDYFESYKMEIVFGEWSRVSGIHEKRQLLIRNFRLGYGKELRSEIPIVELLCNEIWSNIPKKESQTGIRDGRTRLVPNMLRAYFEDMAVVIKQGMNLLSNGGYMHIVVDQSSYVGVPIPTDIIFANIADKFGYEVIQITKCRNANTSGQQLQRFPYLRDLLRESIVTIHKPQAN